MLQSASKEPSIEILLSRYDDEPDKIESFLKKDSSIDLIIHGHTHRYRNENIGKIRIINPGECAGIVKGKNSVGAINLEDLSFERIFF